MFYTLFQSCENEWKRGDRVFIEYKDFVIRNAIASDSCQLAAWWNDGAIMAHAGFPNGTGETEEEIASRIQQQSDDSHRCLMLEKKGIAIGEMFYRILDNEAEIGIKICDFSLHDHGYGKVLLSMLIEQLFIMGCKKVVLDTNEKNMRAQHVYETLGFIKLGVRKHAWMDQLGVLQSSVDYAVDKDQFHSFL